METITINEAIIKIQELGFTADYWTKNNIQRIYINFKFNGSKRTGGFIGSAKSEAKAALCGKKTKRYQDKLDIISKFNIQWDVTKTESKKTISNREVAIKVAQEISIESDYNYFGIGL